MDQWLKFLGWYLSEGSLRYQNKAHGGKPSGVTISQINKENHQSIIDCFEGIGVRWSLCRKSRDFYFSDVDIASDLLSLGKGFYEKSVPKWVFSLSPRQIELLLGTFHLGDGYYKAGKRVFYTSSPNLVDDLQILIGHTGSYATVQSRSISGQRKYINDHWATTSVDGFVVSETTRPEYNSSIRKSKLTKPIYKGKVYCLTVPPNHLMYTRRNGSCIWSGNSGVDDVVFDALEGSCNKPGRKMMIIGNPLRRTGRFAQVYLDHRYVDDWVRVNVSYLDSSQTNGVEERKIREKQIEQYGERSAFVQARIFGRFPTADSDDTIITREELNMARKRDIPDDTGLPLHIGIDLARFGQDESVWYVRRGMKSLEMLFKARTTIPEVIAISEELASKWAPAGVDPKERTRFVIDEVGLGAGPVDGLTALGWEVCGIHNGSKAMNDEEYFNMGAQLWIEDAKETIQVCDLIDDEVLAQQLEARQYQFTGKGKQRRLVSKDELRRRGIESPDRAEAFVYAFAKDEHLGYGSSNVMETIAFI